MNIRLLIACFALVLLAAQAGAVERIDCESEYATYVRKDIPVSFTYSLARNAAGKYDARMRIVNERGRVLEDVQAFDLRCEFSAKDARVFDCGGGSRMEPLYSGSTGEILEFPDHDERHLSVHIYNAVTATYRDYTRVRNVDPNACVAR
jgi:hypothetical protein